LADVIPKTGAFLAGGGFVLLAVASFVLLFCVIEGDTICSWDNAEEKKALFKSRKKKAMNALFIGGVFLISSSFIPSQKTIYMMAGATVAKQAMDSAIGKKVQNLIESKLDELTEEISKKGK